MDGKLTSNIKIVGAFELQQHNLKKQNMNGLRKKNYITRTKCEFYPNCNNILNNLSMNLSVFISLKTQSLFSFAKNHSLFKYIFLFLSPLSYPQQLPFIYLLLNQLGLLVFFLIDK